MLAPLAQLANSIKRILIAESAEFSEFLSLNLGG